LPLSARTSRRRELAEDAPTTVIEIPDEHAAKERLRIVGHGSAAMQSAPMVESGETSTMAAPT